MGYLRMPCLHLFVAATCFFCVVKEFVPSWRNEHSEISWWLESVGRLVFVLAGPNKRSPRRWFQIYFLFPPRTLEKTPILTHISQLGWLKPPTSYPLYWNPEIHGAWGLRFPNLPPLFRGNPKNFQVRTVQGTRLTTEPLKKNPDTFHEVLVGS